MAVTGEGGSYNLENIKTGMYRLTAKSGMSAYYLFKCLESIFSIFIETEKMAFDRLNVRISPTTPSLPDIVASSYRVCGQISLADLAVSTRPRQVIFIPTSVKDSSVEPALVSTDESGSFCHFLRPGIYKLEPMALESEVAAGLKYLLNFQPIIFVIIN